MRTGLCRVHFATCAFRAWLASQGTARITVIIFFLPPSLFMFKTFTRSLIQYKCTYKIGIWFSTAWKQQKALAAIPTPCFFGEALGFAFQFEYPSFAVSVLIGFEINVL